MSRINRLKRECALSEGLWSKGEELLNKYDPDQKIRRGIAKTALAFVGGGELDDEVELIKPYKYRTDDDDLERGEETVKGNGNEKALTEVQKVALSFMKDERLRKEAGFNPERAQKGKREFVEEVEKVIDRGLMRKFGKQWRDKKDEYMVAAVGKDNWKS